MTKYNIPEIANSIFAVGAKDTNRRLFDAFMPLPKGTSFNSYLIKGIEKTALIDTVGPGFENEIIEKLTQANALSNLDYLIMNHAEPDHGLAIPRVLQANRATLITSEKGAAMASRFYGVSPSRIKTVKEGDQISLGDKTLRFIDAAWLHWPEVMFTYAVEDKVLFSCDFFGAHLSYGTYADEVDDIIPAAKSYFGEIMMPFRSFCKKVLGKLEQMPIEMIAPSHGPVYRNPKLIVENYRSWAEGKTRQKVILVYTSMWYATDRAINVMAESLLSEGIEVKRYNLASADFSLLVEDLVDSRGLVIGYPTVLAGIHPLVAYALNIAKILKPPIKYGAVLNSYGWSKGGSKPGLEYLESAKIEVVGSVEFQSAPLAQDEEEISNLAQKLAEKIKANVAM
jgi:flavorubredoxin